MYAGTCGSWLASDDRKYGAVHQAVRVIVGDHREQSRSHSNFCLLKLLGFLRDSNQLAIGVHVVPAALLFVEQCPEEAQAGAQQ